MIDYNLPAYDSVSTRGKTFLDPMERFVLEYEPIDNQEALTWRHDLEYAINDILSDHK